MTIFGTMLSVFMITLGVLLAGLATHGRFGPQPSFFYQPAATATVAPDPAHAAALAAQIPLWAAKTRFVATEPAPAPAKANLERAANPATQAARKPAPKKPQHQQAQMQAPKPHQRPAASGWGWNWPLLGN